MSKKLFLLISFIVVLGLVGSAAAATKTWTGAISTDWFDDNNWDPAGVPVGGYSEFTGDAVHINSGVPNFPVINTTDPCAWCRKLWLGSAGSGDSYLTIEDGGELTVRSYNTAIGNQTIVLGKVGGTHGILTMTGGTINMRGTEPGPGGSSDCEEMEVGGRASLGRGTFNMTGGQFNDGKICMPGYDGLGISAVNLDGGVIDCNVLAWSMFTDCGTLNLYSGTIICDWLRLISGGYCNLYGGTIRSDYWKMWCGFGVGHFGQFDIYDGVWLNTLNGTNGSNPPHPGTAELDAEGLANWYTTIVNPESGEKYIVAYGGRGVVALECYIHDPNDPNMPDPNDPNLPMEDWPGYKVYADVDPNIAHWPNPDDGFAGASPEQTLSWAPSEVPYFAGTFPDLTLNWAQNAAFHDVYFGTDYNDVNNATLADPCGVYFGRRDTNSITRVEYNPAGILVMGPTYYWRIDEVNDAEPGSPWKGDIWSFSISYLSIDDFESYFTNDELKVEWKDNSDPENSTYCYAFSHGNEDQALDSRSMYLTCMNAYSPFYGEVWHNFAQPQDWSPASTDARLLAMSYYGKTDNSDAGLYMKLKDSLGTEATQWISKDPGTCKVASWTEGLIPLNGFAGVDLSKISRVTIGVGVDPPAATGMVYIWVDNVRLYLPDCHPDYLRAAGDINGDCTTDFSDLDILVATGNWLVRNWDVEVIAPVGDPCLWYKFDGNALDSSDNGYNGTITDTNGVEYVAGYDGQALVCDGNTTQVAVPLGVLDGISKEVTVSFWMYGNETSGTRTVFDGSLAGGEFGDRALFLMLTGDTTAQAVVGNDGNNLNGLSRGPGTIVGQWTHWAITKNCDANEMRIYINGELLTGEAHHTNWGTNYNIPLAGITEFVIGTNVRDDDTYTGLIDDFRIYDYAMSQGEILALAGETVGSTFIQPLQRLLMTSANINLYDDVSVDAIDFKDYAVLANTWLQTWTFGDYPDNIY